jgi:hypothetical protein
MKTGDIRNTDNFQRFIKTKEDEYELKIRLIQDNDAEFICNIRNDFKARFLNGSVNGIEKQVEWIHEYKKREREENEFYFIFWNGEDRIGTIRFIKIDDFTFESASWLFVKNIPFSIIIRAELFCKDFAFEYFNFDKCYFYINKKNIQVIRYHNLFQPLKLKEDNHHVYFTLSKEQYYLKRNKILSYIV